MTTTTTRWRVAPAGFAVIACAIVAETASNALRAYALGAQLERYAIEISGHTVNLIGAALILAAIALAFVQARGFWLALAPDTPLRLRLVGGGLSALLLVVSFSALFQQAFEAQRVKTSHEDVGRDRYKSAQSALAVQEAKLTPLKRFGADGKALPRPRDEIQAQIDALNPPWKAWVDSKHCTDITKETTKAACAPVLALYEEQGAYATLVQIEPDYQKAKAELAALPVPTAQASTIETDASSAWAFLFSSAVVLIATFGATLFSTPVDVPAGSSEAHRPTALPDGEAEFEAARRAILADHSNVRPIRPSGRDGGQGAPRTPRGPAPDSPKERVLHHITTELALGRSIPRQADLVDMTGVPRSTISDWIREWEKLGDIPARRTVGRCKMLAPVTMEMSDA